MDSMDRVLAVLAGARPDRPPFSFWYHFPEDQVSGPRAVEAHVHQHQTYQTDFIKVMNDSPYPHEGRITSAGELSDLVRLHGDEGGFGRQLELISSLRAKVGYRVLLTTTVFNAWAVLRTLVRPPSAHHPPVMNSADAPSDWLLQVHRDWPDHLNHALAMVGDNLARFARRCLAAGADGIFLSVRDDWVDRPGSTPVYDDLVRLSDLRILAGAEAARFNILHVCGASPNLLRFSDYPAHAINWADRSAGPSIREAIAAKVKPAICAGIDNLKTLPDGDRRQIHDQVADAVRQAAARPVIIAPGCTFNPDLVSEEALHALSDAVRNG